MFFKNRTNLLQELSYKGKPILSVKQQDIQMKKRLSKMEKKLHFRLRPRKNIRKFTKPTGLSTWLLKVIFIQVSYQDIGRSVSSFTKCKVCCSVGIFFVSPQARFYWSSRSTTHFIGLLKNLTLAIRRNLCLHACFELYARYIRACLASPWKKNGDSLFILFVLLIYLAK